MDDGTSGVYRGPDALGHYDGGREGVRKLAKVDEEAETDLHQVAGSHPGNHQSFFLGGSAVSQNKQPADRAKIAFIVLVLALVIVHTLAARGNEFGRWAIDFTQFAANSVTFLGLPILLYQIAKNKPMN